MRVIGITGWSGAGKTTLIKRIIPRLIGRGLSVSTVKHAHHGFDVDHPGKDSYAHRVAGATEVLVSSPLRVALMQELRGAPEPELHALLTRLSPVDLVLVEGFKREPHPKLEVHRGVVGKPYLFPGDADIVAIASDGEVADATVAEAAITVLPLDDVQAIVDVLVDRAIPLDEAIARGRAAAAAAGAA
ncbi:molybdopterin-guanine dinucleotide biosynthesis protein B [Rhodoplanes elegans]|uniref:Molybdopterin-guanine dinucleotide biosynthesis protein B n=1 Tax=Rhodoplanes elegans TaxID=29408 RepID=A0A327KHP7_9BRAD|nr:molybdopterin-guanine dinucleotide biosynthesis protein B [Rhodoplanes elegans]MBK5957063.1 molybdopterin-guanine dinucleotide biosynthesis protein B [Rhodoplanes elegans]RAI37651.1 molybdopterin-guanine dinucleotide biosynthesis protein B [Rhodoplanes elegans]